MEVLENLKTHVESHKVDHLKRAHGMVEPQLDGLVDVGSGSNSRFEHGESFVADESVYPGSDKSGGLVHNHGFLLHPVSDGDTRSHGLVGGLSRPHDFDKTHLRNGIKEMHADAALTERDDVGEIGDGQRGSIAGKDGLGLGELIEDGEQFELHFKLFGNGFDNQFGVTNGLLDDRGREMRERALSREAGSTLPRFTPSSKASRIQSRAFARIAPFTSSSTV